MTQRVAAIQLNSQNNIDDNLACIDSLVADAKKEGALLALLPENCIYMGKEQADTKKIAEPLGDGKIQKQLSKIAYKYGKWLIVGAMATIESGRIYQTALVYNDLGHLVEHYHKRHLFDVTLPENNEAYRESDAFGAGNETKVVETPVGKVGLSICYDLRFPEHFTALIQQGATVLVLPAAFTYQTGQAHWEVLLRARAIENQCYLIAAGQTGMHPSGRRTWGHSMIINPWGKVLSCLPEASGIVTAEVDAALLKQQRQYFPTAQLRCNLLR